MDIVTGVVMALSIILNVLLAAAAFGLVFLNRQNVMAAKKLYKMLSAERKAHKATAEQLNRQCNQLIRTSFELARVAQRLFEFRIRSSHDVGALNRQLKVWRKEAADAAVYGQCVARTVLATHEFEGIRDSIWAHPALFDAITRTRVHDLKATIWGLALYQEVTR